MTSPTAPFAASRSGAFAFISYSHADLEVGFHYLEPLHHEGFQLWFDDGLTPTESWNRELSHNILECSILVLFVSGVSVMRPEVLKEIRFARSNNKPVLMVHLEPTTLPAELEFETGGIQGVLAYGKSHADVVGAIRQQLESHGVSRVPQALATEPVDVSRGARRAKEGMPGMRGPRSPLSVTEAFADRVSESEALTRSVERMQQVLLGERPIENGISANVLVFYGGGGVGKSGLSRHLERWVSGGLSESGHWGPWLGGAVIPVRWDFNDSQGDVQFPGLMRTLRHALCAVPHRFLAFDLALAAYLDAVGTLDRQGLGLSGEAAEGVLSSLKVVAAHQRTSIPDSLDVGTVRRIVARTLTSGPADLLDDYDLAEFLAACERNPQGSQAPELVAGLIYLLTQELFYLPQADRPALVVFIDHFERLQRRMGHSYEPDLARVVANLPFGLFVITGRDKLDWSDPRRTDLDDAGPHAWPGLADTASSDPRQHLLGRLSESDTRKLYEQHRTLRRWRMPDDVVNTLVRRSEGLPIHIEAVLKLTQNLHAQNPEREFDASDLDGDLPEVVTRLVNVLTDDERTAFRAACVLPFFDVNLAAAVGGLRTGPVEQTIRYALVEENRDSSFPFRVHDEVRRLVRLDRSSDGYWGDRDWVAAARRGLDEAKRLIADARKEGDELKEIQSIALAIRLSHDWDLRESGLEQSVTQASSIRMLSNLLPAIPTDKTHLSESEVLMSFVQAASLPFGDRAISLLEELSHSDQPAAVDAQRFLAYRLRSSGRVEAALTQLSGLVERDPARADYAHFQYAVTLRMSRRFRDALGYAESHVQHRAKRERFRVVCQRMHGMFDDDTAASRAEARAAQPSTRVRLESEATSLSTDAALGRTTLRHVTALLDQAVRRSSRGDTRTALHALGLFVLADPVKFSAVLERLRRRIQEDESNSPMASRLLTLRAMLTGDPSDRSMALDSVPPADRRRVSWIPNEVWLEELSGQPLEPAPTQWLVPYGQVRENWLGVARGIIERAGAAPAWDEDMQRWWIAAGFDS